MNESERDLPGQAERQVGGRIETAGWGLFLAWVGVAFLLDVGWGVGLLGVGVLLLGLQVVRRYCGVGLDWFGLVAGTVLLATGIQWVLGLGSVEAPVGLVPLALIVAGLALVISAVRGRRHD